jgi:hypothetical protein
VSGRDSKEVHPECKSEASPLEPTYYVHDKGILNCVENLMLLTYVGNTAEEQRMNQAAEHRMGLELSGRGVCMWKFKEMPQKQYTGRPI